MSWTVETVMGDPLVAYPDGESMLPFPLIGLNSAEAFALQNVDPAILDYEPPFEQCNDVGSLRGTDKNTLSAKQPLLEDKRCNHTSHRKPNSSSTNSLDWQSLLSPRSHSPSRDSPKKKRQPYSEEICDSKSSASGRTKRSCISPRKQQGHGTGRPKKELREANRIAAAKHRKKKRKATDLLDENLLDASTVNGMLRQQTRELRNQLARWRTLALEHGYRESGCECAAIQQYNMQQANAIVLEAERRGNGGTIVA